MLDNKVSALRKALLSFLLSVIVLAGWAQSEPVHFSVSYKQVSDKEVDVIFTGNIDNGWHVYSSNLPSGGPTSATVNIESITGARPAGQLRPVGKEINVNDPVFGMRVRYFEHHVQFVQKFTITASQYHIRGYLEYGACNDNMCMPPQSVDFETKHGNPSLASEQGQGSQTTGTAKEGTPMPMPVSCPLWQRMARFLAIPPQLLPPVPTRSLPLRPLWIPCRRQACSLTLPL